MWRGAIKKAFEGQDKPIIEAQQRMLHLRGALDIDDVSHATLNTDAGPIRSRYVLRKLLEDEAGGAVPDPQHNSLEKLQREAASSDILSAAV